MKKLLFLILLGLGFSLSGCGESSSTGGSNTSSLPYDGYYVETAAYINGDSLDSTEFTPCYMYIDNGTCYSKVYDNISGHYQHYSDHVGQLNHNEHGDAQYHHSNGGSHHNNNNNHRNNFGNCYDNVSADHFSYQQTDSSGNVRVSVFERVHKDEYDNQ